MSINPAIFEAPQIAHIPEQSITPEREATLRSLLDGPYAPQIYGNYETAVDLGLIDEFYYDPETHKDSIAYMLSGGLHTSQNGITRLSGFHHEPSGPYGKNEAMQRVLHHDRYMKNSKEDKLHRQFEHAPFEPYAAVVALAGLPQAAMERQHDSSEATVLTKNSSMFPAEYDALGVLRLVVNAKNNRDASLDEHTDNGRIIAQGQVPMLDGKTLMRIQIYLDEKTGKILNAHPIVVPDGEMKLSEAEVDYYLYGSEASLNKADVSKSIDKIRHK